MYHYTLVVVDMQHYFYASRGINVISGCQKEIRAAKRNNSAIIFVEYGGCGPTLPNLTDLVERPDYSRVYHTIKHDQDGSCEVANALAINRLASKNLRVCGVNTNLCVASTVVGLHYRLPNSRINVVADACYANSDRYHLDGLAYLRKFQNVCIK